MSGVKAAAPQRLVLDNIDWQTYSRFLRLFAERPGYRLTYDRGVLEIMSPLPEHEGAAYLLGRFVDTLTLELGLKVKAGRSTTFRRRRQKRGLEPDNSYWIASEPRVHGKLDIDLRVDPPPDLAIEIDVTRSSLNRMRIYATLGVPEVWRFDGSSLEVNVLRPGGRYATSTNSLAFPWVTGGDLTRFLALRTQEDDNAIVIQFQDWVRQNKPAPPSP